MLGGKQRPRIRASGRAERRLGRNFSVLDRPSQLPVRISSSPPQRGCTGGPPRSGGCSTKTLSRRMPRRVGLFPARPAIARGGKRVPGRERRAAWRSPPHEESRRSVERVRLSFEPRKVPSAWPPRRRRGIPLPAAGARHQRRPKMEIGARTGQLPEHPGAPDGEPTLSPREGLVQHLLRSRSECGLSSSGRASASMFCGPQTTLLSGSSPGCRRRSPRRRA